MGWWWVYVQFLVPIDTSQPKFTDLSVSGHFQKHSSISALGCHDNSHPCILHIFLYVPILRLEVFCRLTIAPTISAQHCLARSGISASFVTMVTFVQQRYQFHRSLLLDVAFLKYHDDGSNLLSAPLL